MATAIDTTMLAGRLRIALGHLIRRLRAERVRPQSMTQIVADLEAERLIERSADPDDGRRTLVALTAHGLQTLREDRRDREGWLARMIADDLSPREQQLLTEALPLLERLAED